MNGIARDELSWNSPTARGRCLTSSHVLAKASLGSLKTGAIWPACGRTRASKLATSAVLGAALVSRALPVAGLCDRERHARQGKRIRAGPVPPDEKRSRLKILGAFLPMSRDDLREAVCAEASVYPLVVRGVARYDLATPQRSSIQRYKVPEDDQNSEPVFVSRPGSKDEDDGWLLVCVYRRATDSSDVVILDARDIGSDPLATVRLPRRIPAGFHGAWLPGRTL